MLLTDRVAKTACVRLAFCSGDSSAPCRHCCGLTELVIADGPAALPLAVNRAAATSILCVRARMISPSVNQDSDADVFASQVAASPSPLDYLVQLGGEVATVVFCVGA